MSDYLHQQGYIYPLGKLSDEENNSIYKKIKGEENFKLDKDKFELEYMGKNDYLIWLTYSTYGEKSDEFGSCRPCNQQEIYYHAPKFREILGEIDTAKLKFIDFCYYNSTECTVDYYEEKEYKPMTLNEAIQHCKDVTASKCDECGKEHQQLAEWLAELVVSREKITRLETELKARHQKAIDTANELAAYEDKTPISDDSLVRNGFTKRANDYYYCNDDIEIIAKLIDAEASVWYVYIGFLDHAVDCESLIICTVGQLRMFLTIEGLNEIAKQFK